MSFHDLRRTFRSIAENLDYGRYTIKRLLNHKEIGNRDATAAGYVQVTERKLREAMYAIEDIVWVSIKQPTVTRNYIHNALIQLVVNTPHTPVKKTIH